MTRRFAFGPHEAVQVLTERSAILPVVNFGLSLRTGTLFDPPGKEGLTRLLVRSMRMGTAAIKARTLEEELDRMGAQLGMSCSQSYVHFGGVVVAHNLEPFMALLSSLLLRPALRPADVHKARREMIAELSAICDDDRSLCARHFRRFAFGEHPFSRPRGGTTQSLRGLTHADVLAQHRRLLTADNAVIGVSGDFNERELERMLERHLGNLSARKAPTLALAEPKLQPGRRVLLVDKPERTQTQIMIGTLGTSAHDTDHVPLIVANTVFGGLFTSRLNEEVRAKRGLSYGASSGFTLSRTRDLWSMHTFPSATEAHGCIALQLELYDRWIERGITARELAATQRYMEKAEAFEIDTAAKRLDQRLDLELLDWPRTYHSRFIERVKQVTRQDAQRALQRRLSREDQVIVVVATAAQILPELRKLPKIAQLEIVPFDEI
jgi:zinc protease